MHWFQNDAFNVMCFYIQGREILSEAQKNHSPFDAMTLLVGRQEGHLAYKKLGVGLLVVMMLTGICTSYSSSCLCPVPSSNRVGKFLPCTV